MENLNIVIVGHIDHGKSTLIGRLLYDTDSLPKAKLEEVKQICEELGQDLEFAYVIDYLEEEREQGITIDTSQIFFKSKKRQYTIIDAPGHVEFIKNMITGASQAEAGILLVAADEGVQEQTKRHANILHMLGLREVIVVVNKMDAVRYQEARFTEVTKETIEFFNQLGLKAKEFIPVSAREGDNIAKNSNNLSWYDGHTILEALDSIEIPGKDEHAMRFAVQDVYKMDKRIIVGKVVQGTLKNNQEIFVLPTKMNTCVSSLEEYGKSPSQAPMGKSMGLTLKEKVFIDRGSILSARENTPKLTQAIPANIFWLDDVPYQKGERITLKIATQEIMAELELKKTIDSSSLEVIDENPETIKNREIAHVIIKTDKPVVIESFAKTPELGRLVLERNHTCAGGIIP